MTPPFFEGVSLRSYCPVVPIQGYFRCYSSHFFNDLKSSRHRVLRTKPLFTYRHWCEGGDNVRAVLISHINPGQGMPSATMELERGIYEVGIRQGYPRWVFAKAEFISPYLNHPEFKHLNQSSGLPLRSVGRDRDCQHRTHLIL